MLQTDRVEKVDEKKKKKSHLSTFHVCQLSKKKFCADLSKKRKSVKIIYIYAPESFHYTLLENDMAYRGLSHSS